LNKNILLLTLLLFLGGKNVEALDIVLTEAVWHSSNIIRLPFTLYGTLIIVRGSVDRVEGNFVFDTGASKLLLHHRHFHKSGLQTTASAGVTGSVRVMGTLRTDTLQIDNLIVTGLEADLLDLGHIERSKKIALLGLLGYEAFQDFEILFDYTLRQLVLIRIDQRGNPLEPLPEWEYTLKGQCNMEVSDHLAAVWLSFGAKRSLLFGLDSGAEQNMLDVHASKRFLEENFEIVKRVKLNGVGRESIEVLSGKLKNARIDTLSFKPMATLITNLRDMNSVQQLNVHGLLGYEFLSQQPMSINHRRRQLRFYEAAAP
jgi:Aspartyl protease